MRKKGVTCICAECSNPFQVEKRIVTSKTKKGQIHFWCSDSCRISFKQKLKFETVKCLRCDETFVRSKDIKLDRQKRYCSVKCANACPIWTEESRRLISESLLRYNALNPKLTEKNCIICNNLFSPKSKKVVTCNKLCRSRHISSQLRKSDKVGGYRPGSGIGKSGWYDGMHFDSTYELAFYLENKSKGIKRNTKRFPFKNTYYIPDFIMEGEYFETKGYLTKEVFEKLDAMRSQGHKITLVDKFVCIPLVEKYKKMFNVKCVSELYEKVVDS